MCAQVLRLCVNEVASTVGRPTPSHRITSLVAPFNTLNKSDRTGADSADWADEPADNSLLNGPQRFTRTNSMTFFAKVRVAGSNPVVRSM